MATLIDEEQQPELELQEGETLGNIAEDNPLDATPIEEPVAEEPPVAEEEPVEDNPDRFASKTQEELLEIVREQDRRIKPARKRAG